MALSRDGTLQLQNFEEFNAELMFFISDGKVTYTDIFDETNPNHQF